MSNIFLTSDTHFGSESMLKYVDRPFNSINEMNEEIVSRWNNMVTPDDIVYHLGDFAYDANQFMENVVKLNGKITLIIGNHDRKIFDENISFFADLVSLGSIRFIEDPMIIESGSKQLWICHYPIQRHSSIYTACGHIHNLWKVARRMLNVGVDSWNFKPVPIERVFEYEDRENRGIYDANVYPDAPLPWRLMVSSKRQRDFKEPTLPMLHEEASRI